jgi:hypothetical protein
MGRPLTPDWRVRGLRRERDRDGEFGEVGEPLADDLVAGFAGFNLSLDMEKNGAVLGELGAVEVQLLDLRCVLVHEFVEGIDRLHGFILTQSPCGFMGNNSNEQR